MRKLLILITLCLLPLSVYSGDGDIIGDTAQTGTGDASYEDGFAIMLSHADFQYTASAGDVVDSLYVWCWQTTGGTIDIAVYDITSGDTIMVGSAETISPDTDHKLYGAAVNIELTAGNDYAVALGAEAGSVGIIEASFTGGQSWNNSDGGDLTATWVQLAPVNERFVAYATVTAGGEVATGQIIMISGD